MYAFPPFAKLPRILLQTRHQVASLVILAPLAFPVLVFPSSLNGLLLACACFLQTSCFYGILGGEIHPLLPDGQLQLVAWQVSGMLSPSRLFQSQFNASWQQHGLLVPGVHISMLGTSGLAGAWVGTWIPLLPLLP